jgi:hypothetical protein
VWLSLASKAKTISFFCPSANVQTHSPFFLFERPKKKENSYGAVVKKKDEKIAGREGVGGPAGGYV